MQMSLRYSAQVFGYVRKPLKKRLVALRRIDHLRFAESRVIERCLERGLAEVEAEAAALVAPSHGKPHGKESAA